MIRVCLLPVLLLSIVAWPAFSEECSLGVGETWVYEHEGPRPWHSPNDRVSGDRIREVTQVMDVDGERQWTLVETWGYHNVPNTWKIDSRGCACHLATEYNQITLEPPMPMMRVDSEENGQIDYVGELIVHDNENNLGMNFSLKRIADETLTVPAGTFDDCVHLKGNVVLTMIIEEESVDMIAEHELWFHESVNGMVKETFRYQPMTIDGDTMDAFSCTSELKAYSKPE